MKVLKTPPLLSQLGVSSGLPMIAALLCSLMLSSASTTSVSAAGMLVADAGFGGVLEIKEQDVRVTINNSVAVTQIDQVFVNTENRQVEALYTFPVPREASVSNFSMWIGGKEMIGEVVEKQRAREIYESYKQQRRDPGLLEQVDYKRFEMRIFPIPAGAEQRVRIEYYQELNLDHDWATYVYPLATEVDGRQMDTRVTGRLSLTLDVKSEVPIEELRSESHADEFVIAKHDAHYAQAAMELSEGELSRDIVLAFQTKRARTGLDLVTSRPKGEDGYFMMTVTPGEDLQDTAEPMDYLFLLDISGSMARDEKLGLSLKSAGAFIDSLGPEDRFDCLAFNITPSPLFQELRKAERGNLDSALKFFHSQRARGGTVLQPALTAAYAYRDDDRPLNVILLSDGMTEAGEQQDLLRLIQARPEGVRVFCVGVGNEVNRPLLEQMATEAGGLAAFVSTQDSFARQAQLMRQKLVRPAIEDLVLRFDGAGVSEVEPQALGDLFYGTPLRLLGRYGDPGTVTVTLTGKIQGGPWKQTVEMELPKSDEGNSEIERIWAQKRVSRLLAEERADSVSHAEEIVGLCEGYSIVSKYASMLVLENDAEYKRWKIDQRNAIRIQRDRDARDAVQGKLAQLRRQAEDRFQVDSDRKLVSTKDNQQPDNPATPPNTAPPVGRPQTTNRSSTTRGRDLSLPSRGGGGGAIDPVTAVLALGAAGATAMAHRRRKRTA